MRSDQCRANIAAPPGSNSRFKPSSCTAAAAAAAAALIPMLLFCFLVPSEKFAITFFPFFFPPFLLLILSLKLKEWIIFFIFSNFCSQDLYSCFFFFLPLVLNQTFPCLTVCFGIYTLLVNLTKWNSKGSAEEKTNNNSGSVIFFLFFHFFGFFLSQRLARLDQLEISNYVGKEIFHCKRIPNCTRCSSQKNVDSASNVCVPYNKNGEKLQSRLNCVP